MAKPKPVIDKGQRPHAGWRALPPRLVTASLTAGALAATLTIILQLSLAALIFSGPLATEVARGVGLALWGGCTLNLIVALRSSQPGIIACPQDAPAAVLALATGSVAAQTIAAAPEVRFATAMAILSITTLVTSALFWTLGWFRLGSLIRILPYPVLGGFLAGTGWLLLTGGVRVIVGTPLGLAWLQPAAFIHWLLGLLFGVVLLVALRRFRHVLVLPGLILTATALFYVCLWLAHVPFAVAESSGWLLGPFPAGALWQPLTPTTIASIDWLAVLSQSDKIATAAVIAILGLLLNSSGLELVLRQDLDLDRELRVAGIANLAGGLGGSPPGYHYLGMTTMVHRIGGATRLTGLIAAIGCVLALAFGTAVLGGIPRVVLGGMLIYLGLAFLVEWLYDAWFRLPRRDYVLIVLILVTIATIGLLPGIMLGLIVAVVLFIVSYSRISAVRHTLTGASLQSRMHRAPEQQALLRANGEQTIVLQLQGYLFFATANDLVARVHRRINAPGLPSLRFVLLDFRQVIGADSTATQSLMRLQQLAQAQSVHLVIASLNAAIREQLARAGFPEPGAAVELVPDLDRGLEWCERAVLRRLHADEVRDVELGNQLRALAPVASQVDAILTYFERRTVAPGSVLMHKGELANELYFIESGQITAQLVGTNGEALRLESMRGGRIVGELGFYRGGPRTADVVVDEPSVVYRLTRDDLRRMEYADAEAAALLHAIVARLLADRVVHLMTTVEALQR
jgi:SulP family sulfate permease